MSTETQLSLNEESNMRKGFKNFRCINNSSFILSKISYNLNCSTRKLLLHLQTAYNKNKHDDKKLISILLR